uniref:Probable E3 ubiquitin-protein ligase HERC6 n=1 Tax=Lepisosteus oculatus TaxID=7918 RepID=W5MSA4_LEPOC|nr:PREDICTED: probable E3 ubiquitin-protein ligase HERC6 [Lepisosteus oculatus]
MYCWGEGTSGQLGLDLQENDSLVLQPAEVHPLLRHVSLVACGEQHTLFLNEEGKVLSSGRNSKGQLGRQSIPDQKTPARVQGLTGVVSVACGQEHSLALCQSGQVYSWGRGSEGQLGTGAFEAKVTKPRKIQALLTTQIPVIQVACGNFHSLALSKGGAVFSWGQNSLGQLGLGKGTPSQPVPTQVLSLSGVPVSQIAAGGAHSFALSLSGAVYCWGANNAGQLGINRVDEKGRFSPCAVTAVKSLGVSCISCGEAHTAALTKDGSVYTFGDGRFGQLGHNSTANELKPRKVEHINDRASEVACGRYHTLVHVLSSGLLLSFGSGSKGQLGNGDTANQLQPVTVQQTWSSQLPENGEKESPDYQTTKLFAGWNTSFIHTAPPECSESLRQISKIDGHVLQKWLTVPACGTDWKEAKSEITLVFSSSSCLVASFLRNSTDSPPSNVSDPYIVDLQAVRSTLRQLEKKTWISKQIASGLREKLIPNLLSASGLMKLLDIFLILPECEAFHADENIIHLVLPLATAILNLKDSSMETLKKWWSFLEPKFRKKHIHMFKRAVAFILKSGLFEVFKPKMRDVLCILKHFYKANKKATHSVPLSEFYIDEIALHLFLDQDLLNWRLWAKLEDTDETPIIFCRFPFVLNLQVKTNLFYVDACLIKQLHRWETFEAIVKYQMTQGASEIPPKPIFQLRVTRPNLVRDTFRQLNLANDEDLRKELSVEFVGDLEQTAVNKKDFFLHIFDQLIAPDSGMFWYNESNSLMWFPSNPTLAQKRYFLFGILCGLAMYNNNIVHLPFPLAFFKKLVGVKPTLEDLEELDSVLGRSLKCILESDEEDFEVLDLTFTVSWDKKDVHLDPQENEKAVNNANKKQFVSAFVDYVFNKSVAKLFEEFKRGFYKVCNVDILEFFQPEELMGVIVGKEDYDWEKLKQNTLYEGEYHANHANIRLFWEVFDELSTEEKKSFLLFVTGCDRVPILGMNCIKMRISILPHFTEEHFPESLTCHSLLLLPKYSTKERLRTKLIGAINHKRGFWKE